MKEKRTTILAAVSMLALAVAGAGAEDRGPTVTEGPNAIVATAPGYRVTVQRVPYALSVAVGERTILAHGGAAAALFVRDGRTHVLGAVQEWRSGVGRLDLTIAPDPPGPPVEVALTFREDRVEVVWAVPGGPASRLAESFSLAASGHWYGGNVTSAHHWPLETGEHVLDPFLSTSNQTSPAWVTSRGAAILVDTYDPMGFSLNHGGDGLFTFNVKDTRRLAYRILMGRNIAEAHRALVAALGRPETVPPRDYFTYPIFNTWIEHLTHVDQTKVLAYARKIRENGFAARLLEIDDGWAVRYGDQSFDPHKFPDPAGMVKQIHDLGFRLALWTTPFVAKDAASYPLALKDGWLVMDAAGGAPCIVEWWNGKAALVDLSNPAAYGWFLGELRRLERLYGLDGFKLDAGDAEYLPAGCTTFGRVTPNRYTDLFAGLGRHFAVNELRVSWRVQPLGLVERLRDKNNNWSLESGLGALIPHGLAESLIGYPYFCPDMIGGGLDSDFKDQAYGGMDPELFVRWTEASALMPMMQFSYAPWRLDEASLRIVKEYAELHRQLGDYIFALARKAQADGTPIVRPLFFRNPEDEATYAIRDQFLLGERFLVAPVLKKGARARDVYLSAGLWKDFWSGRLYEGPQTVKGYPAPIERLPIFVSIGDE